MAQQERAAWDAVTAAARAAGFNVTTPVDRDAVQAAFDRLKRGDDPGPRDGEYQTPADFLPGYRAVLVLGSAGRPFWERFQALPPEARDPNHPLDRFTEAAVAPVLEVLRAHDPEALAAFPFSHVRQLVPFQALTQLLPWTDVRPLGILVHPEVGPWFAWRAVLLTTLPLPRDRVDTREAPCVTCAAPCVTACPAHAVDKAAFNWKACVDYRLKEEPCRGTCLARMACPAGADYRYGADQLAYHYGASYRTIVQWAKR